MGSKKPEYEDLRTEQLKSTFNPLEFNSLLGDGSETNEARKQQRCTRTLWFLVFTGAAIHFMVRMNMNIAIVAMVKKHYRNASVISNECITNESSEFKYEKKYSKDYFIGTNEVYDWDEHQQNLILGAVNWIYPLAQLPGGLLGHHYGTKLVFGINTLIMSVLGFVIPLSAATDFRILIAIRLLQGILAGLSWPSLHNLTASWVPPKERSNFVTSYNGNSIGVAVVFSLGGLTINQLGWEAMFHIPGILGLIWFIVWWFVVYDTPQKHPRISDTELKYIEQELGPTLALKKPPTPWKDILKSLPFWINVFALWGDMWGLNTLMTQAPTYFKVIHGWNIFMTGVLSGVPYICRVIFSYTFSLLADCLLKRCSVSHTRVRKIATFVCCIVQGIFIYGIALSGCDSIAAIVCITAATITNGASSSGPFASFVDLSPNFASILMGISGMVCFTPAFLSPILVSELTYKNQTIGQWNLIFIIVASLTALPGVIHLFFSTSKLQKWNSCQESTNHNHANDQNNEERKTEDSNDQIDIRL
ncbi:sialin-like isoform X1 [Periplaneta americana]|uniref:sialin-like isoform X1 n=2 Tax=Periplaneta americana TaxID=6978 RepID=UPI0037E82F54